MSKADREMEGLDYPFQEPPSPATIKKVADGVFWLRMPMPFSLDHINLWMLESQDGWTLVDTGLATDETVENWQKIYQTYANNLPVKQVIVTHMHPDHIGLAGWITRRSGAQLLMSRADYLYCHHLLCYSHTDAPEHALQFYRSVGFSEEQIDLYQAQFGGFGKFIRALPHSFMQLKDNTELTIGNNKWRVILGYGHSTEHVCLYCEEKNIFISGDQVLPTISSNISVHPTEPNANPLEEWLASCHHLAEQLNNNTLVLPAHGMPFIGAPKRLLDMSRQTEADLSKLLIFCQEPRSVIDAFPILFKSTITRHNLIMATGESLAHFNCLLERGLIKRLKGAEGIYRYQRI